MTEGIIIALIGAAGVVIAAIIALIGVLVKKKSSSDSQSEKSRVINQRVKGNNNIQIGDIKIHAKGGGKEND